MTYQPIHHSAGQRKALWCQIHISNKSDIAINIRPLRKSRRVRLMAVHGTTFVSLMLFYCSWITEPGKGLVLFDWKYKPAPRHTWRHYLLLQQYDVRTSDGRCVCCVAIYQTSFQLWSKLGHRTSLDSVKQLAVVVYCLSVDRRETSRVCQRVWVYRIGLGGHSMPP